MLTFSCVWKILETYRNSFCVASAILLRRFHKLSCIFRGRRITLETSIVILRGRRRTSNVSRCVFFLRIPVSGLRQVVTMTKSVADVACCDTRRRSTLHTLRFTLYTPHFALHTSHFALYTPHFALDTVHSALSALSAHSTLYTPHFTLYIIPHSLHSTLYSPHSTLHTPPCTLHT